MNALRLICVIFDKQTISSTQQYSTDSHRVYLSSTDEAWISNIGQTISFPGGGRIVMWGSMVSLSPATTLSLCLSPATTLFVTVPLSLFVSLCHSQSLSPALNLSLYQSRSLCLSLPVTLFITLTLSVTLPLSLALSHSRSLCH